MNLFKLSLASQMAIAILLGLLCGLFFGDLCEVFAPYSAAYVMILKITAVPFLIGAIIHGIGQLSISQAKMILKKGVLFIILAWAVNITMIYATYFIFPKSSSSQRSGYIAGNIPSINFAELLIPENIFYDLTNNIIPSIVIFSLLLGIALMHLKEKQVIIQGFQLLVEALTRITGWIAKITPIGTFIIIANQAGTVQFSTIKQVSSYLILYILTLSLIVFWIFPRIVNMLTMIPARRWLQQLFPILLLAYTTNAVIICLPYIMELLRKETLSIDPYDEKAQTQIQGTVSVILNLPLGSLFITVFVFFISLLYNTPLIFSNQIKLFLTSFLTSLGASGIGSWINSLTFILDSIGLPQDAIPLFLTTLPFTSGFQAMVSASQISALALLTILASRKLLNYTLRKIVKGVLFTGVPLLILFTLIKTFNPLPEIKNNKKSIFELTISSPHPAKTYKERPSTLIKNPQDESFTRILETKKLRVGYSPNTAPFCFFNLEQEVVGYDITFAYELAYDLGCELELIPMNYKNIAEDLQSGLYDIAMSAVSVTEQRLKNLSFTESYLKPEFVFVTTNAEKRHFSSVSSIKNHPEWPIAILKGTSYETIALDLFPDHPIILIDHPDDFTKQTTAKAFLWTNAEAIAWSLSHRDFRVVFPSPSIGNDSLAYAILPSSPELLNYLDRWLELKTVQGFTEKQYNLWVLEKTEIAEKTTPRWSILRYLGWDR